MCRWGAIQMTWQPEVIRRVVMSFCPSACWVPLYRPSEDHQDARGTGGGEAQGTVQGADCGGEVLVPVGGPELGDPGGDRAGVGDSCSRVEGSS
jgi:hypothetical protein